MSVVLEDDLVDSCKAGDEVLGYNLIRDVIRIRAYATILDVFWIYRCVLNACACELVSYTLRVCGICWMIITTLHHIHTSYIICIIATSILNMVILYITYNHSSTTSLIRVWYCRWLEMVRCMMMMMMMMMTMMMTSYLL